MRDQVANVEQVAQGVIEFAIVEEMDCAVQNHVLATQHADFRPVGAGHRGCQQPFRIRAQAGRVGYQVVMYVDHALAQDVAHRRQFVHPGPVVALVVLVLVRRGPAVHHQDGLDALELIAPDEDIEVTEHPASPRWQLGHGVGCALEQDQWYLGLPECQHQVLHLPAYRLQLALVQAQAAFQMAPGRGRDVLQQALFSQ